MLDEGLELEIDRLSGLVVLLLDHPDQQLGIALHTIELLIRQLAPTGFDPIANQRPRARELALLRRAPLGPGVIRQAVTLFL